MKEDIIKKIKGMEGSLLIIGEFDALVLDKIEDNDKIDLCYVLSNNGRNNKKYKLYKKGKKKTVNIKKLSKYFRIKSIDNIICDYTLVKKYIRSFQGENVYINKGKTYIYGLMEDLSNLKERYERFSSDIKLEKKDKYFCLVINNTNSKTNLFKNTFYKIIDLFSDILDYITELLAG